MHLQEAPGVRRESLERALCQVNLQAGSGGDVADGDATAEVVDGVHGAVAHVSGEAVGLYGATKAREARCLDGTCPGPRGGAARGRETALGDVEAVRRPRGGRRRG